MYVGHFCIFFCEVCSGLLPTFNIVSFLVIELKEFFYTLYTCPLACKYFLLTCSLPFYCIYRCYLLRGRCFDELVFQVFLL